MFPWWKYRNTNDFVWIRNTHSDTNTWWNVCWPCSRPSLTSVSRRYTHVRKLLNATVFRDFPFSQIICESPREHIALWKRPTMPLSSWWKHAAASLWLNIRLSLPETCTLFQHSMLFCRDPRRAAASKGESPWRLGAAPRSHCSITQAIYNFFILLQLKALLDFSTEFITVYFFSSQRSNWLHWIKSEF